MVRNLDRNHVTDADAKAVDTGIQPAAQTLLSVARKLPLQGTHISDVLRTALEKHRPGNCHCIDGQDVPWSTSLPMLLTAWVARDWLPFHNMQLFYAHFESVPYMPPPTRSPISKLPSVAPKVDLADLEIQASQASLPEVVDPPIPSKHCMVPMVWGLPRMFHHVCSMGFLLG